MRQSRYYSLQIPLPRSSQDGADDNAPILITVDHCDRIDLAAFWVERGRTHVAGCNEQAVSRNEEACAEQFNFAFSHESDDRKYRAGRSVETPFPVRTPYLSGAASLGSFGGVGTPESSSVIRKCYPSATPDRYVSLTEMQLCICDQSRCRKLRSWAGACAASWNCSSISTHRRASRHHKAAQMPRRLSG